MSEAYVDIKVRGYHLDIYQHVNNGRYLEFLEEGRWDYFESKGFFAQLDKQDLAFVVANINISYRRPAYAGETIRIITKIISIGNKSAKALQEVRLVKDNQATELIVDAEVTFCLMDNQTQKSIPISGEMRENLERMIAEAQAS